MTEIDEYLPRHLTSELREAIASARVVNLVGPRQVGKTTLVRDLFEEGRFLTLDDAAVLAAMDADPEGQLMSLAEDQNTSPIIIDEAQRSRKLALAIKKIVDNNRRKGQFVLTGSSNVFTTAEVADSLAGRMRTLKLWPLSVAEINTSELAKLAKLKRETVDQYLDILLRISMVTRLSAWMPGEGKRDIKQPKFHFVDTGIAMALRRLNDKSFEIGNTPEALGGLLESLVVGELQRALPMQFDDYRISHWRSADRRKIDIMIDGGHRLVGVEVKAAATVSFDDFKHLKWFAKDGPGRGSNLIESDHAAMKRLLGYRQSFRSFRTAKATLSGIETIRTIKRGNIHHKQPGVQGEIRFIAELFDAAA